MHVFDIHRQCTNVLLQRVIVREWAELVAMPVVVKGRRRGCQCRMIRGKLTVNNYDNILCRHKTKHGVRFGGLYGTHLILPHTCAWEVRELNTL